jgi:predicted transport protein
MSCEQILFYTDKSDNSFESHLVGLEEQNRALLLELRTFIKSLGDNVIEETRPHRIAYAKSLNFRTFVDVQPKNNSLIISIRKGRTEPLTTCILNNPSELKAIKVQITEAYKTIR